MKGCYTNVRRATLAFIALTIMAQPAHAAPGKWVVEQARSALTGAASITATLPSEKPLTNMIGQPEAATLVVRCGDHVLAAYVVWPGVVSQDMTNFIGEPKTIVLWRLDEGKISDGLWAVSDDGTAAGAFTTNAATKLLGSWRTAHQLIVRITAQSTQDAVFDITGIDTVSAQTLSACGASINPRQR